MNDHLMRMGAGERGRDHGISVLNASSQKEEHSRIRENNWYANTRTISNVTRNHKWAECARQILPIRVSADICAAFRRPNIVA